MDYFEENKGLEEILNAAQPIEGDKTPLQVLEKDEELWEDYIADIYRQNIEDP